MSCLHWAFQLLLTEQRPFVDALQPFYRQHHPLLMTCSPSALMKQNPLLHQDVMCAYFDAGHICQQNVRFSGRHCYLRVARLDLCTVSGGKRGNPNAHMGACWC